MEGYTPGRYPDEQNPEGRSLYDEFLDAPLKRDALDDVMRNIAREWKKGIIDYVKNLQG